MKTIQLEFEVGEGLKVDISLEICGFAISLQKNIEYFNPDTGRGEVWKPSKNDLKSLIIEVKEVMMDLHIQQPPCFVLKLTRPDCRASNCVDKSMQIFYISLPVDLTNSKPRIKCKHDLYHELMHIEDVLYNRFPSIGRCENDRQMACFLALTNFLLGFSIEGRLERMDKPHRERKDEENQWLTLNKIGRELCDRDLVSKEQTIM